MVALLVAPLLLIPLPAAEERAIALPGLAPVLGVAGLGAAYPAFAGLFHGPWFRALLGACGCLWLGACEIVADRTFVLGPEVAAPRGWEDSVGSAVSDVVVPLLQPPQLLLIGAWAVAAAVLPLLVRGRSALLDAVGALIWAAGLISVHRLVAGPEAEPAGLLLAAIAAACVAAFAAPRLQHTYMPAPETLGGETATGARI